MRANYTVEFASGLFILLGIAALLWLATSATDLGNSLGDETYQLNASFTDIGDLKPNAPVKMGGVTIGVVDSIELDRDTFDAVVRMRIDSSYDNIPDDSSAAVLTSGVLGDRYLGVEPGGSPESLIDGDSFLLTQSAIVLEELVGKYLFNSNAGKEDSE